MYATYTMQYPLFFFFGCCDKNVLSIEMVWSIPSLKRSIYKELPTIAIQDAMNYTAAFCLAFFFSQATL